MDDFDKVEAGIVRRIKALERSRVLAKWLGNQQAKLYDARITEANWLLSAVRRWKKGR